MSPNHLSTKDPSVVAALHELIARFGAEPASFKGDLTTQMLQNSLKLIRDGHSIGQVKLINSAFKEIRYAYHVFNQHPQTLRVSIFGSARTPEEHPDYIEAKNFSKDMSDQGWMAITGAAEGIMKAGHEGSEAEDSFGLSIRLPYESLSNEIIAGDPKLITFRYFFTRKLMFLSHSHAIAAFPGGFGTQDELFECLTLMQTGKSHIMPVVLLEGPGGVYWKYWDTYVKKNFLKHGWICNEDLNFYYIAKDNADAVRHITKFYRRFHSYRYVKDQLVIRIKEPLKYEQLRLLNLEFQDLLEQGELIQREALKEEAGELQDLPRLIFTHTKKNFGQLRTLIDSINSF